MSDEDLGTLILGMWAGAAGRDDFPLWVRSIEEHRVEDGRVDYFDLVTGSGLRFRTRVELIE